MPREGSQPVHQQLPTDATRVTPKKRKVHSVDRVDASSLVDTGAVVRRGPALVEEAGFASAALLTTGHSPQVGSQQHSSLRSPLSASPSFAVPPPAPARNHFLDAFADSVQSSRCSPRSRCGTLRAALPRQQSGPLSALVAVEVQGMGRVAVGRDVARQLGALTKEDLQESVAQGQQRHIVTTRADKKEEPHSAGSSTSSHTSIFPSSYNSQTPSQTGSGTDPSPSFSLSSHFPASEDGSPLLYRDTKRSPSSHVHVRHGRKSHIDADLVKKIQAFKTKISKSGESTVSAPARSTRTEAQSEVRPGASDAAPMPTLPRLDWPNSPTGPWAATAAPASSAENRLRIVAHWLDVEGTDAWEDEASQVDTHHRRRVHRHPMVARVMGTRSGRNATGSVPRQQRDKGRGLSKSDRRRRLGKSSIASSRTRRTGDVTQRPESKRFGRRGSGLKTSSSSVLGSSESLQPTSVNCYCRSKSEDVPMVQCDACERWYHMSCAGVRDADDLGETWYCSGCDRDADETKADDDATLRIDIGSPATTIALGHAPSTVGSHLSSTPGFSAGIPAFPRTYASHVGVGTPSSRVVHPSSALTGNSLPVFTQPSTQSPSSIVGGRSAAGLPLSSALALAPSPHIEGTEGMHATSIDRRQAAKGRARASRIGWHAAEPDSPLNRKSLVAAGSPNGRAFADAAFPARSHQTSPSRSTARAQTRDAMSSEDDTDGEAANKHDNPVAFSPSIFTNVSRSEWDLASLHARRGQHYPHSGENRTRTPSPTRPLQHHQYGTVATPSRVGPRFGSVSAARGSARTPLGGSEGEQARDADDVFSTPSRHLPGSAWWGSRHPAATTPGKDAGGAAPLGLQTPSRSARRRESSGWALGLATPSSARDLFPGGNGTDVSGGGYSVGMPSLVFSSGGVLGEESDFPTANWQSSSPTRSVRSASRRSRQISSGLAHGPSLLSSQLSTSSIRSSSSMRGKDPASDETDPPTSSSPYPRTPSMDLGHRSNIVFPGTSSTPGSPTPSRGRMHSALGGVATRKSGATALAEPFKANGNQTHQPNKVPNPAARLRQVSVNGGADIAQFGLGLDLDEILDYF
ncbi:unnamed protein product [Parajaminaea phylloscopi]